jgi:TM2 domain-containing membrane protein YozV
MKKSTKAALLSGLVFPGIGHLVLKQHLRAVVLVVISFVALWVLVDIAFDRALTIVDQINSGNISLDSDAIAAAVSDPGDDSLRENISGFVLVVCWLIGIFDSYRIGVAQDKPAHDSEE